MQTPLKSLFALLLSIMLMPVSFAADKDKQLATVNGEPIMTSELITYARMKSPQADLSKAETRQRLIQAYVGRELLYQEALKQKLDQQKAVQIALDNQRREVISQALVGQILRKDPVTEKEAKAFYDKQSAAGGAEYKAQHILTKDEKSAKQAIERLNSGEDFAKVAQKFSTDPSASRGGELGWLNPGAMPPAFGDALKKTPAGQYTKTPVQTKYGWHIIKVEATRPVTMPSFGQVKGRLMQLLAEQKVSEYVSKLQKQADIKITK
jgi:peptidyl-prolyl cis-trans isomerase C